MSPEVEAIYREAQKLDDEFHAALVAAYGERRAGDMRYATDEHPPEIAAKARSMQDAADRLHAAVRREREGA